MVHMIVILDKFGNRISFILLLGIWIICATACLIKRREDLFLRVVDMHDAVLMKPIADLLG